VSYRPSYPVVITVDSLLIAQNGIVEQYQRSMHLLVLAYYSRKVVGTKKMWAATMLELDGLCWILKKATDFIENQTFSVITDHRAIQYILGYKGENRKITEKALFLTSFGDRLVIVHKPGHLLYKADPLSRLVNTMTVCYTTGAVEKPDLLSKIRKSTAKDKDETVRQRISALESDIYSLRSGKPLAKKFCLAGKKAKNFACLLSSPVFDWRGEAERSGNAARQPSSRLRKRG
jgi:hypothetical protein